MFRTRTIDRKARRNKTVKQLCSELFSSVYIIRSWIDSLQSFGGSFVFYLYESFMVNHCILGRETGTSGCTRRKAPLPLKYREEEHQKGSIGHPFEVAHIGIS